MGPTFWIVAVALPAIIAVAVLFPAYVLARYAVLRRHGEGNEYDGFRRMVVWVAAVVIPLAYVFMCIGVFSPGLFPSLSRFLARGGLAFIVPLIFLDFVLGMIFSPARALALRDNKEASRGPANR